jgi:hypothetical protein
VANIGTTFRGIAALVPEFVRLAVELRAGFVCLVVLVNLS